MVARPRVPRATYLKAVKTLVDVLSQVPIGSVIKLDVLSRLVGWEVANRRHVIHAAFRQVRQETGRDFQSIANVGYRVLPEMKVPESPPTPPPVWFQTTVKPELLAPKAPTPEPPPAPEANLWAEVEAALRRAVLHTARQALDSLDGPA